MSQVLFAFVRTVTGPRDAHFETIAPSPISESSGGRYAMAVGLRQTAFDLPAELRLVAERVTISESLTAAGFSDPRSPSVGVDVANWSQPCSDVLNEIAWRRVFTWIVGTDNQLTNVAILEPPMLKNDRLVGAYAYDADGISGYGVLQIVSGANGGWHICDCWGDATDADRIDALSSFTPQA